jgi:hypothetical protein
MVFSIAIMLLPRKIAGIIALWASTPLPSSVTTVAKMWSGLEAASNTIRPAGGSVIEAVPTGTWLSKSPWKLARSVARALQPNHIDSRLSNAPRQ